MKTYTPKRKNRSIMHSKELSKVFYLCLLLWLLIILINYPVGGI